MSEKTIKLATALALLILFIQPAFAGDIYKNGQLMLNATSGIWIPVGNVGIGTSTPQYKLHVVGGISAENIFVNGSSILGNVTGSGTKGFIPQWAGLGVLNESVIYQNGTNVGIGTTSPNVKLEIAGIARFTGANGLSIGGDTSQNRIQVSTSGFTRLAVLDSGNNYLGVSAKTLSIGDTFGGISPPSSGALIEGLVGIGVGAPVAALHINSSSGAGALRIESTTGSSLLFANGSSGNIGIGTISPSFKLDVSGPLNAHSLLINGTSIGSGNVTGSGTASYIPQWASNSVLNNSVIFQNGTRLGVGTTSPDNMLHLFQSSAGSVTGTGQFVIESSANTLANILSGTSGYGSIDFGDGDDADAGRIRYEHGTNQLDFYTNGNNRMTIDSLGKLEVNAAGNDVLQLNSTVGDANIYIRSNQASGTNWRIRASGDGTNILSIGKTGANWLVVNDTGYIGIGTISQPAALLDVNQSGEVTVARFGTSGTTSTDAPKIRVYNGNGFVDLFAAGTTGSYLPGTVSGDSGIMYQTNRKFHFGIQSARTVLTLDSAGNVGINTTSPTAMLEVNSSYGSKPGLRVIGGNPSFGALEVRSNEPTTTDTIIATLTDANKTKGATFKYNATNSQFRIFSDYFDAGPAPSLVLGTFGTQSNHLALINGGNVGINTTSPTSTLHVVGDANITGTSYLANLNIAGVTMANGAITTASDVTVGRNLNVARNVTVSNNILFVSNLTERVGIGTTNPSVRFEINGSSTASTNFNVQGLVAGTAHSTANRFALANGVALWFFDSNGQISRTGNSLDILAGANLTFTAGGSERIRISPDGFVGIGTTNPGKKLEVTGDIVSRQVATEAAGTATAMVSDSFGGNLWINSLYNSSNSTAGWTRVITLQNSTGNVGVGTSIPKEKLDVRGNLNLENLRPILVLNRTTSPEQYWNIEITEEAATKGDFAIREDSSSGSVRFIVQNNTGNIGIGTTTPAARLHSTSITEQLRLGYNSTHYATFTVDSNANLTISGAPEGGGLFLNPTAHLHLGVSATDGIIIGRPDGNIQTTLRGILSVTNATGTQGLYQSGIGRVGVGTSNPANALHIVAGDEEALKIDTTLMTQNPAIFLSQAGTNKWEIYGDNSSLRFHDYLMNSWVLNIINGKIGVNNTGPTGMVDVAINQNTAISAYRAQNTNYGSAAIVYNQLNNNEANSYWQLFGPAYTTSGPYMANGTSFEGTGNGGMVIISHHGHGNMSFHTNGTANERMRITSQGNVGIGTLTPSHKLTLTGDIRFTNNDASILYASSGYTRFGTVDSNGNNFAEKARLDQNGSLGIGTTAPEAKLHLIKNTSNSGDEQSFAIKIEGTQDGDIGLLLGVDTIQNVSYMHSFDPNTGWDRNLILQQRGGNVGIGTAAPLAKLNVVGSDPTVILNNTGPNSNVNLKFTNDAQTWQLATRGAGGLNDQFVIRDETNSVDALTIEKSTGNVGIGTTSPSQKLHVEGNLNITGTIYNSGADVAERVATSEELEAGDVAVIDQARSETVRKSYTSFDTRVAGVISTKPALELGSNTKGALLALSGRVPVKVTNENGAILPGDLLTTSNTPGHAMKCASREECSGSIIGKAMEGFAGKRGTVIALISLG